MKNILDFALQHGTLLVVCLAVVVVVVFAIMACLKLPRFSLVRTCRRIRIGEKHSKPKGRILIFDDDYYDYSGFAINEDTFSNLIENTLCYRYYVRGVNIISDKEITKKDYYSSSFFAKFFWKEFFRIFASALVWTLSIVVALSIIILVIIFAPIPFITGFIVVSVFLGLGRLVSSSKNYYTR